MSETISIDRDAAADAVAIVKLLRGSPEDAEMALFVLSSYNDNVEGLHALIGSMAALSAALLKTIDSMADQLNRSADVLVPGADAVLAAAAQSVACFDPSKDE